MFVIYGKGVINTDAIAYTENKVINNGFSKYVYNLSIIFINSNTPMTFEFDTLDELLKALKKMVKMYEDVLPCGGYQGVYEEAKNVIEKATT